MSDGYMYVPLVWIYSRWSARATSTLTAHIPTDRGGLSHIRSRLVVVNPETKRVCASPFNESVESLSVRSRETEIERESASANLSRSHSRALLELPLETCARPSWRLSTHMYDVCIAATAAVIRRSACSRWNEKVVAVALRIGNDDAREPARRTIPVLSGRTETEGSDSNSGTLNRVCTESRLVVARLPACTYE